MFLFFLAAIHSIVLQQCSALPRIFGFIFFGSLFWAFCWGISHINLLQEICQKTLTWQFCTQRKNIKQNVKFGSHIFYPFPTRNTIKNLTTYNVCNNTEIHIKKRCYTKQIYNISKFSIILFFCRRKCFFLNKQSLLLSFL